MDDLVGILDLALKEAGLQPPVLVGHSISAVLATRYAARHRTSGVINVDQPLVVVPFAELLQSRQEVLRGPGYLALWERMLAGMHLELLPGPGRLLAETISDPRQDLLLGYWDELLTENPAALGDRMSADLAAVRANGVPYQTVFGQDPSPEYEKWLMASLPDAVITVLPAGGHFPQLADPAAFAGVLTEFPGSSGS
jgi:pimeloyl-ACP methyl ester carboxylesterase